MAILTHNLPKSTHQSQSRLSMSSGHQFASKPASRMQAPPAAHRVSDAAAADARGASHPPRSQRDVLQVTRDNCWEWPARAWTSAHMREVLPTARIARGTDTRPLGERTVPGLSSVLTGVEDAPYLRQMPQAAGANAVLFLHRGDIVFEGYAPGFVEQDVHCLLSMSRCTVGLVASRLLEQGVLTLDTKLGDVVPALGSSGYAAATIEHVLNMRSGVASKVDPAEVQAAGWKAGGAEGLTRLLQSWPQTTEHGGPFVYRSGDTQALALACEAAAGRPYTQLLSECVWQHIGAEQDADMSLDRFGVPMASGGLCATLRDTGRLGQALLDSPAYADWMQSARGPDADCQRAFEPYGFFGERIPGGMFRNQFWALSPKRGITLSYGAYGQMLWVDPSNQFVAVVFSSWEGPISKWIGAWRKTFEAAGSYAESVTIADKQS